MVTEQVREKINHAVYAYNTLDPKDISKNVKNVNRMLFFILCLSKLIIRIKTTDAC